MHIFKWLPDAPYISPYIITSHVFRMTNKISIKVIWQFRFQNQLAADIRIFCASERNTWTLCTVLYFRIVSHLYLCEFLSLFFHVFSVAVKLMAFNIHYMQYIILNLNSQLMLKSYFNSREERLNTKIKHMSSQCPPAFQLLSSQFSCPRTD